MIFYDYYGADEASVGAVLDGAALGRLITVSPSGMPHVGLYPFTWTPARVGLHLHHEDEQIADIEAGSAVVFEVDDPLGVIPSHWLHPENAAMATAYHRTVILEGTATLIRDGAGIASGQNDVMARYQPEQGYRPVTADDPLYARMVSMLVGVDITVTRCRAKFKLAQNRTPDQRRKIVANLRDRGTEVDLRAAAAVEATLRDEPDTAG